MSEWKEYRLFEFVQFGNGKERPKTNGNIPVFGGNGILGYCDSSNYNGETIIIGRVGAYCGSVYYQNKPIWVSDNALAVKPKNGYNAKFIYYFLKNIDLNSYAEGSSHPLLTQTLLNSLEITITKDVKTQTAIAEVLSSLDDKIDLLHRQNKTLEQLAETLFRKWFIEEAEESWEEITFGDLVKPKKGKNLTKSEAIDGEFPVVAGGLEPSCYHNQANTKSPVITISASGANAGYVRLYYTPVWSSDSSFIDETITPYIFFSYIFLKINQKQLTDKQEGSAQPHIYPNHVMELDMLNYPNELIEEFEKEVTPLFQKIKSNTQQIRTLTQLRDTLLPKLMSGEVRVNIKETIAT